jgi:hypothetical protein
MLACNQRSHISHSAITITIHKSGKHVVHLIFIILQAYMAYLVVYCLSLSLYIYILYINIGAHTKGVIEIIYIYCDIGLKAE